METVANGVASDSQCAPDRPSRTVSVVQVLTRRLATLGWKWPIAISLTSTAVDFGVFFLLMRLHPAGRSLPVIAEYSLAAWMVGAGTGHGVRWHTRKRSTARVVGLQSQAAPGALDRVAISASPLNVPKYGGLETIMRVLMGDFLSILVIRWLLRPKGSVMSGLSTSAALEAGGRP